MWFIARLAQSTLRTKQLLIVLIGLLPFVILTCATNVNPSNDDAWFRSHAPQYGLAEWVDMRYQTWSGRVTAEAFTHTFSRLPIAVWHVVNVAAYALLVLCLYGYYTLLVTKRSEARDLAILALCTTVPFVMGVGALLGGAFWITGSFFYLWIAALGLTAFYPILYVYLKRALPPVWLMATGTIAAALAGLGQEQVFALLAVFTGIAVAGILWQTRRIWLYPVVQLVVTLLAAAISYSAPGNKLRMDMEVAAWLPTFHTAPFLDKFEWSLRWFMDASINHFGFLFVLIWLLVGLLILAQGRLRTLDLRDKIIVLTLMTAVFLHLGSPIQGYLFNFHAQWGVGTFPALSYVVLAFWMAVLFATIAGLYRVSGIYLKRRFVLPLVGLGAFVATAIITLSPTMYASEQRTLFVPGILTAVIVVMLAAYVLKEYWTHKYLLLAVFLLALAVNLAALLAHRSQFFQVMLG